MRKGGAISVSPKPPARSMIDDSCLASAIVPATTVIVTRLALPAGTRYNTSGLECPPLWPGLACPPMAGFEVSTEAPTTATIRCVMTVPPVTKCHAHWRRAGEPARWQAQWTAPVGGGPHYTVRTPTMVHTGRSGGRRSVP
jgi:hypothetical protein